MRELIIGLLFEGIIRTFPVLTSDVGSFPLMSTHDWGTTTFWQRLRYRISRHPLTILSAYGTVFLLTMRINPLRREPYKHWDGAVSILAHFGLIAVLWLWLGFDGALFAFVLAYAISSALGAYQLPPRNAFISAHGVNRLEQRALHSSEIADVLAGVQLHLTRASLLSLSTGIARRENK